MKKARGVVAIPQMKDRGGEGKSPGVREREVGVGGAGGTCQGVASSFDQAGLEHPSVIWAGRPVPS